MVRLWYRIRTPKELPLLSLWNSLAEIYRIYADTGMSRRMRSDSRKALVQWFLAPPCFTNTIVEVLLYSASILRW